VAWRAETALGRRFGQGAPSVAALRRRAGFPIVDTKHQEPMMTQTSNRFFDEMARLMTDAASVAQGVRREAETVLRTQVERWIADLDLVKREDFDVVRELASKARAENERLSARVAALEAKLGTASEVADEPTGSEAPAKPLAAPPDASGSPPLG
jgi:BMFP domain-containing protein YqiC